MKNMFKSITKKLGGSTTSSASTPNSSSSPTGGGGPTSPPQSPGANTNPTSSTSSSSSRSSAPVVPSSPSGASGSLLTHNSSSSPFNSVSGKQPPSPLNGTSSASPSQSSTSTPGGPTSPTPAASAGGGVPSEFKFQSEIKPRVPVKKSSFSIPIGKEGGIPILGMPRPPGGKSSLEPHEERPEDYSEDAPNLHGMTRADLLKPIQSLVDAPANNKPALFVHKLKLCCIVFDWSEDTNGGVGVQRDSKAKEVKRQQLLELVEFLAKAKNLFTDQVLQEVITMVSINLFRTLPPRSSEQPSEEDDPVFEPSWPHLQIVYEFFLRFIVSSDIDVRTLKKFINGSFILKLLELFDSEDHRERDYLKTILHRIYAKFMSLRAFIRKAINNVFFVFVYEADRHNGIAELLEILGSIINGFALPLKAEHKIFLSRVLIPMHKVRCLAQYHQQLSYCVTQFVDKDPTLSVSVLLGVIKYWPITISSKEVLFLNELEELLELTPSEQFKEVIPSLFRILSKGIGSAHFQVAERALFFWHNEYIANLIAENRHAVLPILFPVLHLNSLQHWNPTVLSLMQNVLKIFQELDQPLVDQCQQQWEENLKKNKKEKEIKQERWRKLEEQEGTKRKMMEIDSNGNGNTNGLDSKANI